jgi:hypothetical protein
MATMWECDCGHNEFGEDPPGTCQECNLIGSFNKIPEDQIEEKEAEHILSLKGEEDED